jgi:hypothetical protein
VAPSPEECHCVGDAVHGTADALAYEHGDHDDGGNASERQEGKKKNIHIGKTPVRFIVHDPGERAVAGTHHIYDIGRWSREPRDEVDT